MSGERGWHSASRDGLFKPSNELPSSRQFRAGAFPLLLRVGSVRFRESTNLQYLGRTIRAMYT